MASDVKAPTKQVKGQNIRPFLTGAGLVLGPWGRPSFSPFGNPWRADFEAIRDDWRVLTHDFTDLDYRQEFSTFFGREPALHPGQERLFEPGDLEADDD